MAGLKWRSSRIPIELRHLLCAARVGVMKEAAVFVFLCKCSVFFKEFLGRAILNIKIGEGGREIKNGIEKRSFSPTRRPPLYLRWKYYNYD